MKFGIGFWTKYCRASLILILILYEIKIAYDQIYNFNFNLFEYDKHLTKYKEK